MTPLHEAVIRCNHEVLREMINVIQDTPVPKIDLSNREEQIRACCVGLHKDEPSLLNRKNKVNAAIKGWGYYLYCRRAGPHYTMLLIVDM